MADMARRLGGPVMVAVVLAASAVVPAGARPAMPDAAAWRAAALGGGELLVPVGDERLTARLSEDTDLFAPGARPEGLLPFEGTIDGAGWIRGAVMGETVVALAATSGGLVSIGPARDGGTAAMRDAAAAARAAGVDTVIEPDGGQANGTCDSLFWQPQVASPLSLVQDDPLRTFDVAVAVDSTYATRVSGWQAAAAATISAVDALFRSSFQIRISIVHLIQIPDSSLPGTTTPELLDGLQTYYRANHVSLRRENVHLLTGREPTNAGGQVNCVGSVGRTTVSYSVSEGVPVGPFIFPGGLELLPDGAMKIAAHELAHTLSAHHHYANCAEPAPSYDPFVTMDACTVMINDWGLIAPVFSSLEKLTVRGWADHYGV